MRTMNITKSIAAVSLAVCLVASLAVSAQADIVYVGVNEAVPSPSGPTTGLYLDFDTGATSGDNFTGCDIHFYHAFGATVSALKKGDNNLRFIGVDNWMANLPLDTEVGPASAYANSTLMSSYGTTYPFAVNADNYAGFELVTEGGSTVYGWMHVAIGSAFSETTIVGYAYETSGDPILIGQVPEPGTAALLLVGALGLLRRRK